MIHRHVWKIVEKTEQPSTAEVAAEAGAEITAKNAWPRDLIPVFTRRLIVTSRCERCGTEKVERV